MNEPLEPCLSKHGAIEALSIFPCLLIDTLSEPRMSISAEHLGCAGRYPR